QPTNQAKSLTSEEVSYVNAPSSGLLTPWDRPERLVWIRRCREYVWLDPNRSFFDVEGRARPCPILRPGDERCLDGIRVDVLQLIPEITRAAQNEIEVTLLPDCPALRPCLRDRETGCTFPVTHQLRQKRLHSP